MTISTAGGGEGGASGGATEATLADVLTELQTKLDAGGTVELGATTVAALQTAFDAANDTIESNLVTVGDILSDILAELLEKIEAGEDVGLTSDAVTALSEAIAAIYAFPVDYPDAATQALLTSILGKLNATVAVTGPLTDTQLRASPVPVSGTVTVTDGSGPLTVDGTVTANVGTTNGLALDATLTGNTQKSQIINSAGVAAGVYRDDLDTLSASSSASKLGVYAVNYGVSPISGQFQRFRTDVVQAAHTGKLAVLSGGAVQLSLNAVTTTGAGSSIDAGCGVNNWGMQVVLAGTVTAAVVVLEGSMDGSNWNTVATFTYVSTNSGLVFSSNQPFRYGRANVTTYNITGGSITARLCPGS